MLKTILILTTLSLTIFLIAGLLMKSVKGVRMRGAHARGEQRKLMKHQGKWKPTPGVKKRPPQS